MRYQQTFCYVSRIFHAPVDLHNAQCTIAHMSEHDFDSDHINQEYDKIIGWLDEKHYTGHQKLVLMKIHQRQFFAAENIQT